MTRGRRHPAGDPSGTRTFPFSIMGGAGVCGISVVSCERCRPDVSWDLLHAHRVPAQSKARGAVQRDWVCCRGMSEPKLPSSLRTWTFRYLGDDEVEREWRITFWPPDSVTVKHHTERTAAIGMTLVPMADGRFAVRPSLSPPSPLCEEVGIHRLWIAAAKELLERLGLERWD